MKRTNKPFWWNDKMVIQTNILPSTSGQHIVCDDEFKEFCYLKKGKVRYQWKPYE